MLIGRGMIDMCTFAGKNNQFHVIFLQIMQVSFLNYEKCPYFQRLACFCFVHFIFNISIVIPQIEGSTELCAPNTEAMWKMFTLICSRSTSTGYIHINMTIAILPLGLKLLLHHCQMWPELDRRACVFPSDFALNFDGHYKVGTMSTSLYIWQI